MNILQAAILGLVQGLGEFLPISSYHANLSCPEKHRFPA